MSDEEIEYEYEDDDENQDFEIEDDDGEGEENEQVETENQYYNAKDKLEEDPAEAAEMFEALLTMDEGQGGTKFTYKGLKKLVVCCTKLKRMDDMMKYYDKLLDFRWDGHTRTHMEKAINKAIDIVSDAPPEVQARLMEKTLKVVDEGKNYEKLAFQIRFKLGQFAFERGDFAQLEQVLKDLDAWCTDENGNLDSKKETQFVTAKSLEIQMRTQQGNNKALQNLYTRCLAIESAIPPPKIMGIIHECGGKMFMRQARFGEATTGFFHAFKCYDEAAIPRRIDCLKYLVLATVLSNSDIDPFDSSEAKPYKGDPEIVAMTSLIEAFKDADIVQAEKLSRNKSIANDEFMVPYVAPLLRTVRMKVCVKLAKPYTRVKIAFIAETLGIDIEETERLLSDMILDHLIDGHIDQVSGLLFMETATSDSRAKELQSWTDNLLTLNTAVIGKSFQPIY